MPPPFNVECGLLDRISSVAASQSPISGVALAVLQQVAVRRPVTHAAELEAQIGARRGDLQRPTFSAIDVRVHALRSIGRAGTAEAVAFLTKLKPSDLGPDPSHQVWPAAQIALREALLNSIADSQGKTDFLEKAIREPPQDAMARVKVMLWAMRELCDSGALMSLPVIQSGLHKLYSATAGEEIQFCEARIRVIRSDPDRVKALGSTLEVHRAAEDSRLTWWAINKLAAMKSPNADAELDRFADVITKLPEGSLPREQTGMFRQAIIELRRGRK
jgi:hypothetical protein